MNRRALMMMLLVWLVTCGSACRGSGDRRAGGLGGDPERGRHLIAYYGCGSCHTIPRIPGANTVVGPPLWGMADRGYIGGVLPNTEEAMVRWLMNPQAQATRTAMPNLYVTEEDARHITAYLYTLRAEPVIVRMVRGYVERATGRSSSAPVRSPEEVVGG